jgi:hypothetical protein
MDSTGSAGPEIQTRAVVIIERLMKADVSLTRYVLALIAITRVARPNRRRVLRKSVLLGAAALSIVMHLRTGWAVTV